MKFENLIMNVGYTDTGYNGIVQVVILRMTHMSMVNYSYLVVDHINNQAVIVDPAWDIRKVEQALENTETVLSGILLTHSHLDHIHLAQPLAEKYSCPIWMSNEEIAYSGYYAPQLEGINITPWSVGQIQIEPLFTPGHTPGGMCYLIGNSLFSGDTLFAEGCGLCFDVQGAHKMFDSIEHLKKRIAPDTLIFPGHSYGRSPGQEFSQVLKHNIYLQFKNKNDFTAYRLRKGQNKLNFFDFQ
ncbi:hydroxyacylglutathione hydrolase [Aquimarina sp. EL_43]|uniref:MBL fold metallo-hydrolase n=1 Tax=unclassified Aquimarina TaxID=2627091 RepID=UPI001A1D913C|nr:MULTISPECIES: MBL fold metallo-hydrolase [unclassified Aquimarina]MBG6133268.1 hydroxyacylglutathione hydrolase [Aquimarina sp. EL_35]MBG6153373.1 hydroxyacylglutathione hydrolase [Aquimarina sp. EL_32]MBG6171582.1 hydroxyacylglutathione hydrolase [Aquimarina sp. EL_43]